VLSPRATEQVDYLSLDVEGAEQGIIESVPWDKVDIRVLQVSIPLCFHNTGGCANISIILDNTQRIHSDV
jgi:hypothetical protein